MQDELLFDVPKLTTANTHALNQLEQHILDQQTQIEAWLRQQWRLTPPPINCSVDLRNAGFKLAPVDTNLFPAGFNNLNREFLALGIQAAQSTLEHTYPGLKNIVLIPESHTRNVNYFASLAAYVEILSKAGYEVRIGTLIEEIVQPKKIQLPSGTSLTLEPMARHGDKLSIGDFEPELIIMNNDLSSGVPAILQNLSQAIQPSLQMGWSSRLKSVHFKHYAAVAEEVAKIIDIDPWFINPYFRACGEVDFMQHGGEDCLVKQVSALLKDIQQKYDFYGVKELPFVVVKADRGTYGMGVMMIRDPEELTHLTHKERTKMSTTKGNQKLTQVIIQEGVYTFETWGADEAVAEPVVYMLGSHVVGGFYRVHQGRGKDENLNSPGMQFEPLAFTTSCNNPDIDCHSDDVPNRFYAYGVIARLALVAAARELHDSKP